MNEAVLKNRIMLRVKATYFLKHVVNAFTFKCGALIVAALAFGSLVHVAAVFSNLSPISVVDIAGLYSFSTYAFMNTGILVQAIMIASIVIGLLIVKDLVSRIQFGALSPIHA